MINHNSEYYSRMRVGLGDKERLLRFIPKNVNTVLDVGGGDGKLAETIAQENKGAKVMLLDASEESVKRARSHRVYAALGRSEDIPERYNPNSVDVIIASSVIHEIFSYGNIVKGLYPGKDANVAKFLRDAYNTLRPGGRLIIRDGFMPKNDSVMLRWKGHDWKGSAQRFIAESPFYEGRSQGRDREVRLTMSDEFIVGDLRSMWEYIRVTNWGENSFEREVQEYYGVYNHRRMSMITDHIGFNSLHFEAYIQDGYRKHLSGVELYSVNDRIRRISLPFTNAVWVFEKPAW